MPEDDVREADEHGKDDHRVDQANCHSPGKEKGGGIKAMFTWLAWGRDNHGVDEADGHPGKKKRKPRRYKNDVHMARFKYG